MWVKSSALFLLVLGCLSPALRATPLRQAKEGVKTLVRGPIAAYEQACARCHGPNGSFYGPDLGKGKTDSQLYKAVQSMADNQGQIELTPVEVEAQTAYHRAIIKREPFLAVTERTRATICGEVTKGSTITVTVSGKPQQVRVVGFQWSTTLNDEGPILITARRKNKEVKLDPDKAAHSHPAGCNGGTNDSPG